MTAYPTAGLVIAARLFRYLRLKPFRLCVRFGFGCGFTALSLPRLGAKSSWKQVMQQEQPGQGIGSRLNLLRSPS